MHRLFAWVMIAILALMLAPFAGVLGVPASVAQADTTAPTVPPPPDDEIIVITSAGVVRADDPYTPVGYQTATWSSTNEPGWETGWTVVAGGDFNGDGDAELVAARNTAAGSFVKVFDPVVQPGRSKVNYSVNLGSGNTVRLLVTGDFDGDLKDEFAVIHYISGGARLVWYDSGANATEGDWTQKNSATYNAMFQDMSAGDFNNDGADDLVMVRNVNSQRLVSAWNVKSWAKIAENDKYCCTWYAVAGGNLSSSNPGDEISLTRDGANAKTEGLILYKIVSGAFADLATSSAWRWEPSFVSLSNGDLNGDGDDEVVMLRDPTRANTSLLMVNPVGASMPSFEQSTGYGSAAFRIVRTGDTDGDGKDEIVILKGDQYWLYYQPDAAVPSDRALHAETPGPFYTSGSVSNLPFLALANVDGPGVPAGPSLSVAPASLSFSLDCGDGSPLKPLSITNAGTGSSFAWRAQAIETNGSGWLLLDTTSGTTPGTVNVRVSPGVAKGNYTGTIQITTEDPAVQIKTVDVPVSYEQLCSGFVVSPTTLNFSDVPWGSTGSQPIAISAPGSTGWSAEVVKGSTWLTLSAPSGTTPSTLYVIVNPAAAGIGVSQGTIELTAANPALPNYRQSVYVNLTVKDPGFVVTPTAVTIWQAIADYPTTVKRHIKIERPLKQTGWTANAAPLSAAAGLDEKLASGQATTTADGLVIDGVLVAPPDWLEFTPDVGATPATMTVNVKPGAAAGTYRAAITVVANGDPTLTNPVQTVYVTAVVANNVYTSFLPLVMK